MEDLLKLFVNEKLRTFKQPQIISHIRAKYPKEFLKIIKRTSYLTNVNRFSERLYQIIYDVHSRPICEECHKNENKFVNFKLGYRRFCSCLCANTNKKKIEKERNWKKKKTQQDWWNIELKKKSTKLERYGDENYCNPDKIVSTKLKNGNNEYFSYRGNYEGFHYDSSWELAFIKFCLNNNIQLERNKKGFMYWYQDKKHKYYPDFYLPEVDQYIEIKGYMRNPEKELSKWCQFPHKLDVYKEDRINEILKIL